MVLLMMDKYGAYISITVPLQCQWFTATAWTCLQLTSKQHQVIKGKVCEIHNLSLNHTTYPLLPSSWILSKLEGMHKITLGETLHTRVQMSRFLYSNNYWQSAQPRDNIQFGLIVPKNNISAHGYRYTAYKNTITTMGCTSQTDIYLHFPKYQFKKSGAGFCASADHLPFNIP